MKIQVTKEDIAKGIRANACECPIALACRRLIGEKADRVGTFNLLIDEHKGPMVTIELPKDARKFIFDFDQGTSVQPFEFEIDYTP